MSVDLVASDSNDSDIFVLEHMKSSKKKSTNVVLGLYSVNENKTEVKKGKVRKHSGDSRELKSNKKKCYSLCDNEIIKKSESAQSVISKKKSKHQNSEKTIFSSKIKTDFENNVESNCKPNCLLLRSEYSPKTQTSEFEISVKAANSSNKSDNYELSPGICSKKQKFKINDLSPSKKKKVKKSLLLTLDGTEDNYSEKKFLDFDESNFKNEIKFNKDSLLNKFENKLDLKFAEEKQLGNSALLCFLLKKIIKDEQKKQSDLQELGKENGIIVEKLLLEHECEIFKKFFNLEENACKVFVRMLGRKKDWHRVSAINYTDIGTNLKTEFEILQKENFVDTKIENEDLKIQMALLSKPEILNLCKEYNMPFKAINNYKKEDLISSLIENSKKQKSVMDMFKKKKDSNERLDLIKNKIKSSLGLCVKISDEVFQAFYKILILFSFTHYFDEEDKRFQNELFLCYQVHKNMIKFPNYKVSPTVVFETLEDFQEYKKSLLLQDFFEIAISNKNHDKFVSAFNKAKDEFKKLLNNNEYVKRFLNLETFLRKFSAGTVYARILTKYCKTFKRKADNLEIVYTTQLLLDQNLFLTGKRGEWYDILSKALENQKQNMEAAEVLINGLKDPLINEVQKLILQLRGQTILKKKTWGIKDDHLRKTLSDICTSLVQEPLKIEIKAKALEGNESGYKSVYIQEYNNRKLYSSVEERAISHYKINGFTKGYHSEGFIVQSLYYLFLFDIIYETYPHGVFQSPYQEAPLDLYSTCFYKNRKEVIDQLLNDMLNWNDEQIKSRIYDIYSKNYNTTCVINWKDEFTPELFYEITKCISMPKLVLIFKRFLKNFRVSRSGFPDLTLWNPETNKCKFVEVKSPSDRLSPAQRLWLDYLRSIELDCEVCNIRNISSKGLS